ncbi:MAG: zf-TFIIB domain-containing protein [Lentisphaeraceae bacterium]|nr:zf-TFIIB domain-containing protein [Lentisphaeraceae bacterium]
MNCPKCKTHTLVRSNLTKGLPASECSTCRGKWLNFSDYLSWQQQSGKVSDTETIGGEFEDTSDAMICPCCTKLLSKYKVSANLPFILDQCGRCHGIWFDKNEWESISTNGLATKLHLFFTEHWQKNVKKELSDQRIVEIFKKKFGAENYEKLTEVKSWLNQQSDKAAMLAFLREVN